MPITVAMPRLSDTMERGTVVSWNVKEGDSVKPGMSLGDIETDKATMELQAFDAGIVAAILVPAGQTVEVSRPILVLAEAGEDVAAVKAGAGVKSAASSGGAKAAVGSAKASGGGATAVIEAPPSFGDVTEGTSAPGGRIFASPLAKKIAEEAGVDLSRVQGTGPAGRIIRRDVEEAASSGAGVRPSSSAAARGAAQLATPVTAVQRVVSATSANESVALENRRAALSNMRRTIANRLVQSKTTIPHYQVTLTVNMDPLLDLRKQLNEQLSPQGVKLSVNDFLVRACALAMHQHPYVNASWGADGESINLHGQVNIGVAISLDANQGGGLVVATLRDADMLGLRMISAQTKALADKARARGLTIEEMSDATFTISNLGMFGVEHFTAIINPPNSAILAVGAAVEKPVVRNGQVVPGHEMSMTMSSDHRVIDGAMAAAYLNSVKQFLEAPATLLV